MAENNNNYLAITGTTSIQYLQTKDPTIYSLYTSAINRLTDLGIKPDKFYEILGLGASIELALNQQN